MYKYLATLLIIISIISSCSTDVDLNADWKETPVIYGVLEPHRDTQFIKINKTFLGNVDAFEMAKIADSSNYPYKLDVKIEKWLNGSLVKTYFLDTITIAGMKDGVFGNEKNIVYYFPSPLLTSDAINTEATYKLYVNNPVTGHEANSTTTIAQEVTLNKPYINFSDPQLSFYNLNGFSNIDFEWFSSKNAKIFVLYVRFNYIEYHKGQTDSVNKQFDWKIGEFTAASDNGNHKISTRINGETFYDLIADKISIDESIGRKVGRIGALNDQLNIMVFAAGTDLSTYIEVNAPSNSIVQDKPNFSNIGNGIGIFSSRYLKTINNMKLKLESYNYLKSSDKTRALNFE